MTDFGIKPNWQLPPGIQACITTVDAPGNLAAHVGDDPARVLLHRRQLQRALGLRRAPKWLSQYHSTVVVAEESSVLGSRADAIWASAADSCCAVLTADCLPILLCSEDGAIIAAIHAGWRGLAQGIIGTTLAQLPQRTECFRAYIGPAISQPHFEVGDEVRQAFSRLGIVDSSTFHPHRSGKWLANLPLLAERLLLGHGVKEVTQSHLCTYSDARFFSHRRDPSSGRIATLIWKI
ncbi:peptidoglycan editing factor PgeF [Pseudidiomarina sp. 1APP75-32.1]|uniref:Purine nucleoside phosphorylase n=1 Tax=Pseudidiomarina terrestris TaxID=2820060 RepID=A0AAW7R008_9GAMM|nr:peptidoglycan editing factor PgeF [Pseudidiomarina sp. 1APP75-32.1]MDN7125067.1 peptidoglycan editing factor PgeF [Pseudidiomarina sp. 1APP75-32.1]